MFSHLVRDGRGLCHYRPDRGLSAAASSDYRPQDGCWRGSWRWFPALAMQNVPGRARTGHCVLDWMATPAPHQLERAGIACTAWRYEGAIAGDLVGSHRSNPISAITDDEHPRIMRYLGCFTAYGVFLWRYLNVPENWAYVGSIWSTALIGLTLLPETIYPFVYIWAHRKENRKAKTA